MKISVFKPLILCLLVLSGCSRESELSPTDKTNTLLQLGFQWEDDLSTRGANSRALTNGFGTGDGQINTMGVYVTTNDHKTYPSVSKQNFTFTLDNGKWASTDEVYLTDKKVLIQTFSPANANITPDNANGKHTIPISIPANQTFDGGNSWNVNATDYLFGSASTALSSVTAITAYNKDANKQIYMHHALAMVEFKIQYGTTRIPDLNNEFVKEIRLASAATPFLFDSGTMQIGDGILAGLTNTGILKFTATAGTERNVGYANSPAIVAYGLVAPLSTIPTSDITLVVKIGTKGNATKDKEYQLSLDDFKVKWQRGYCYTYNLILNDGLGVESTSVSWGKGDEDDMAGKEKGIGSVNELFEFVDTWNMKGLGTSGNDYTPYLDYGWYETDAQGKKQFTIKLTSHIKVTAAQGKLWTPIGTEAHPLTLPFDGQGWQIVLDLTGSIENMESKYAGFIGYTQADIKNLRITTLPAGDGVTNNCISAGGEAVFVGGMAGKVEGNITNCSMELNGTTLLNSHAGGNDMCIGGLAGWCNGKISNCAVYEGTESIGATISYTKAGSGCYMGGLVGKLENGGSIVNSYSFVKHLKNQDTTHSPIAGWLAGTAVGSSANTSYYITGSAENCTLQTSEGEAITNLIGLCTKLNNEVKAHKDWAYWKEENNSSGNLTRVTLELYR